MPDWLTTSRRGHAATLRRARAGQGMVEFALVLTLIVLVLFGSIDLAFLFYAREAAVSAAQEAARVASGEGRTIADGLAQGDQLLQAALGERAADYRLSIACSQLHGACQSPTLVARVQGAYTLVFIGGGHTRVPLDVRVEMFVEQFRLRYA